MDYFREIEGIQGLGLAGQKMNDRIFAVMDDETDTEAVINRVLKSIGDQFDIDAILIKQLVEGGHVERCTYEWSRDGRILKYGNEMRYLKQTIPEYVNKYRERRDGVYVYYEGDEEFKELLSRHTGVKRFLQIPIYQSGTIVGSFDCVDYVHSEEWDRETIISLKTVFRFLSSYVLSVKEVPHLDDAEIGGGRLDSVTGLPKYEVFMDRVRAGLGSHDSSALAVVCCDITNFKFINEKYGYELGDRLLRLFAEQVYECFDRVISCCREYSDHFIMVIKFPAGTDAEGVRSKVDNLGRRFVNESKKIVRDVRVVVNSGICYCREGIDGLADSLTRADIARKYGKQSMTLADNHSVLFSSHMIVDIQKSVNLIAQLKPAIENREFKVYLQPKVKCDTLEMVGAEALIRWQKPDGRFIYPDEFIPAFERDGCIVDVDFFVYEECFRSIYENLKMGIPTVPVSMNVSRVHLYSTRFIEKVEELHKRYPVPVEMIEFEVTEGGYLDNLPQAISTIQRLKSHGFKVSMDDFGSGYSSLDVLTKLPIDVLKLDRVFMKEHMTDSDKSIIICLLEMAGKLGMTVLCEGVETEEQRQFLVEVGCPTMQGYYFSKPLDAVSYGVLIEKNFREHGKIK